MTKEEFIAKWFIDLKNAPLYPEVMDRIKLDLDSVIQSEIENRIDILNDKMKETFKVGDVYSVGFIIDWVKQRILKI